MVFKKKKQPEIIDAEVGESATGGEGQPLQQPQQENIDVLMLPPNYILIDILKALESINDTLKRIEEAG